MLALLTGLVTAENTQLGYKANTKPYQKPQSTKPPQSYSLSEVINTQRIDVSALYFEQQPIKLNWSWYCVDCQECSLPIQI